MCTFMFSSWSFTTSFTRTLLVQRTVYCPSLTVDSGTFSAPLAGWQRSVGTIGVHVPLSRSHC